MKHAKKALFPVSLSNQAFSSSWVVPAVRAVLGQYDEIIILVADRLQLYNHIAAAIESGMGTKQEKVSFKVFESRIDQTLSEREKWLERIKFQVGRQALSATWSVLSLRTITDRRAFDILRRVSIMYEIDDLFRGDVDSWAKRFVSRRYSKTTVEDRVAIEQLSVRYILEEAAISIRLRVLGRIADEFYIGETTEPIANIYWNKYSRGCWELAGTKAYDIDFAFFEYIEDPVAGKPKWRKKVRKPAVK